MTRPTLVDVADAILKVHGDPEYRYFKSSRVRAQLQATSQFTAAAGQLNAQCQPHLREMRHRGWIERVQLENQERDIPYRIVDEVALQNFVLASSLSGDHALSQIADRLAQRLERIDGTIERIEEEILHGRTEEGNSTEK